MCFRSLGGRLDGFWICGSRLSCSARRPLRQLLPRATWLPALTLRLTWRKRLPRNLLLRQQLQPPTRPLRSLHLQVCLNAQMLLIVSVVLDAPQDQDLQVLRGRLEKVAPHVEPGLPCSMGVLSVSTISEA